MLPTISPERAAESSVLVNGGYNKCQYRVGKFVLQFVDQLKWFVPLQKGGLQS